MAVLIVYLTARDALQATGALQPEYDAVEEETYYYENNRQHMRYDEYLAAGYPIGSGVAEGACRHLVKDRLEGTGMRWTLSDARPMLYLRAIYLNGRWNEFVNYHIEAEQAALYRRPAA